MFSAQDLLTLFLAHGLFLFGTSTASECRFGNFVIIADKKISTNSSLLESVSTGSLAECSLACTRRSDCMSHNVKKIKEDEFECELLSVTHFSPGVSLSDSPGSQHFTKKVR